MPTINDIKKRFQSLDIKQEAADSIDRTRDDLIFIQKDQLLHGLNAKGEKIGKYRNNKYARVKNQMNPLPGLGNVDLKVKGDFYGGLFVDVRTDTYIVESGDEKSKDLQKKYGEESLGLNDDSKSTYIKFNLRPDFIAGVRKKLKL